MAAALPDGAGRISLRTTSGRLATSPDDRRFRRLPQNRKPAFPAVDGLSGPRKKAGWLVFCKTTRAPKPHALPACARGGFPKTRRPLRAGQTGPFTTARGPALAWGRWVWSLVSGHRRSTFPQSRPAVDCHGKQRPKQLHRYRVAWWIAGRTVVNGCSPTPPASPPGERDRDDEEPHRPHPDGTPLRARVATRGCRATRRLLGDQCSLAAAARGRGWVPQAGSPGWRDSLEPTGDRAVDPQRVPVVFPGAGVNGPRPAG